MADLWEQYRGGETKPAKDRMHITINNRSVITFNRKMFDLMGEPRAVLLFFNKQRSSIGILKIHEKHADKFRVVERANGGYWVINAAPFCRYNGIRVDQTERFTSITQASDGTLRLDLKDTVTASIRDRKKKRA